MHAAVVVVDPRGGGLQTEPTLTPIPQHVMQGSERAQNTRRSTSISLSWLRPPQGQHRVALAAARSALALWEGLACISAVGVQWI